MSISHILVPTDFSDHSQTAIALGVNLARRLEARLTVLHIDPMPGFASLSAEPLYVPPEVFERIRRDHDLHLEKALADVKTDLPAEIGVTTAVRRKNPVEGIVEFVSDNEVDLVVMGSHGRGATRFLLGSVAEKVSRQASAPVLVTRTNMPTHDTGGFAKVLVGVDYSRFSVPAARLGYQMLDPDGELELTHIWYAPHASSLDRALFDPTELARATEDGRAHEANTLASFAEDLPIPRVPKTYIGTGTVPGAILERAEDIKADLIVVGAHSRESLSERLIGTTADRILRHAKTPVLLVPDAALS